MTKMMKRHMCLFLAVVMVCVLLPLNGSAQAAPAPQAEETEAIPQRGVYEVTALREENVKHFALPDGTYQAVVYGEPIHELDENGQWQEIDNSMYLSSVRGTELYSDTKGNTAFAKSFAFNKPVFSISNGGYGISMSVAPNTLSTQTMATADTAPEAQVTNAASRRSTTYSTVEEAAEVDRSSTVRYANVLPGVDLKYTARNRNVEESIVVKTKADSYSYRFALDLDGLYAQQEENGSISLLDSRTDERKYVIPTGLMYDANETVSYDVAYALTEESGKYYLTVTADEDWVNDPERTMPVSIEQKTINESRIHDTCARISYPEATHGTSQVMWIASNNSGIGVTHALIRGEFPSLPGNATVLNAYMRAYYYYNDNVTTGTFNIGVYPLNGSWNEYDATWNNTYYLEGSNSWIFVAYTSAAKNATINNPEPIDVPLTNLAQEWAGDSDSNNGVKLKNYSGTNVSVCLRSSESGSTYSPRFYITYEEDCLLGDTYDLSSSQTCNYTFTPDESDTYSLWTTGDTNSTIEVYDQAPYTSYVFRATTGGHGNNACLTDEFEAGKQYIINVSWTSSSTSPSCYFKLYRGLPLSGSELPDYFDEFNQYFWYNNCYTYAISSWLDPTNGNLFRGNGNNPGEISGNSIMPEDLASAYMAKSAIIAGVKADCIAWGGSIDDFYEVDANTMVPEGYYKVALVYREDENNPDYHWYRQISNSDGRWAHKRGQNMPQEDDAEGKYIYVPHLANWGNYSHFLGYFAIKPPARTNLVSVTGHNTMTVESAFEFEHKAMNANIDFLYFMTINPGITTKTQVRAAVGDCHTYYGSGFVHEVYYTNDERVVAILYDDMNIVCQVSEGVQSDTGFELISVLARKD